MKGKLSQLNSKFDIQVFLENHVKDILCKYLHLERIEDLSNDVSFFDEGLTSLAAIEIQYELERILEIKLNSTVIFNFPSINKLCTFLIDEKLNHLYAKMEQPNRLSSSQAVESELAERFLKENFNI